MTLGTPLLESTAPYCSTRSSSRGINSTLLGPAVAWGRSISEASEHRSVSEEDQGRMRAAPPPTAAVVLAAVSISGAGRNSMASAAQCQFCQDGTTELADPTMRVFGRTCEYWQSLALENPDDESCAEFEYVGSRCGCSNTPPDGGCRMCPGGGHDVKYPDKRAPKITFLGVPDVATSCAESTEMIQYIFDDSPSGVCPVQQSVIASYCGCPDANEMVCPVCDEGMAITQGAAPPFEFETIMGLTLPMKDFSCLDAEYIANAHYLVDSVGCDQIRAQVSDFCCAVPRRASAATLALSSSTMFVRMLGVVGLMIVSFGLGGTSIAVR